MEISKNTVAVLLVLFILVSAVGTWYAMSMAVSTPGGYASLFGIGGNVNLFVGEDDVQYTSSAGVNVNVVSSA